jgi:aminoglycoside phosphotransferase (APT) family kinase protein
MAELFDAAALAALLREHLPEVHLSPIATGKHNTSYWADTPDHGRFVLRLAPPDETGLLFYERRMMRQEPDLHALIRARTGLPVAEIVAHDFSRTRIDRDWLLMRALPGVPLSDAPHLSSGGLARVLRQIGERLRALHALSAPDCLGSDAYGYLGAHRPMEPQPTWADAFDVMWNKLLDDVAASGCYTDAEAGALRALFDRHRAHFERPVPAALLHMDVWAQNILVDEGENLSGLVDFDRALWGDPEIEFAVLDYCGISEPPFWSGYGQKRDESPSAQIRRQFYLLYEIQKYMPIAVWRGKNPAGARSYKQQSLALAAPLGLPP